MCVCVRAKDHHVVTVVNCTCYRPKFLVPFFTWESVRLSSSTSGNFFGSCHLFDSLSIHFTCSQHIASIAPGSNVCCIAAFDFHCCCCCCCCTSSPLPPTLLGCFVHKETKKRTQKKKGPQSQCSVSHVGLRLLLVLLLLAGSLGTEVISSTSA